VLAASCIRCGGTAFGGDILGAQQSRRYPDIASAIYKGAEELKCRATRPGDLRRSPKLAESTFLRNTRKSV
jgi:hypothetical protein